MLRQLPLLFCLLALLAPAHAQSTVPVVGTISSRSTGQGIPFVNIGLPQRGLGTVSDEQGRYRLPYSAAYAADTVRISSVGFKPLLLPFAALLAAPVIGLVPEPVVLNEVSVTAAGAYQHPNTAGLAKAMPRMNFHMGANELGTELGCLVHLQHRPALLQSLHLVVLKNEAGPLTFRLNIYRLDAQGLPTTEKLLARDVLITATPEAGVLSADVTADHLVLNEDFLLALEWIKNPMPAGPDLTQRISFGGAMKYGAQLYFRRTSQAPWTKPSFTSNMPALGMRPVVALYATVKD